MKMNNKFWMRRRLTWEQCSGLPVNCTITSVAAFDENVYIAAGIGKSDSQIHMCYMYNPNNDKWSQLSNPPYRGFSLVAIPGKKQLLAIGGLINNDKMSNEMFVWDKTNEKWIIIYPNMPTSRCCCSSILHESMIIVAGGITCAHSLTLTTAVEILHIDDTNLHNSHWSAVEQLPVATYSAIPLIIDEKLYIAIGHSKDSDTINKIVAVSLPDLLQSSDKMSDRQLWSTIPNTPYSSASINQYQGRLITFGGFLVDQTNTDKQVRKSIPRIHLYDPNTESWDCVEEIPYGHIFGLSVQLNKSKILFIGGLADTHHSNNADNLVTTCLTLTITTSHPSIIPF